MSLSEDELHDLLRDLESDRVERKESAADRDKLSQAICAFANDMPGHGLPGVLLVGVADSGRVISDSVSDEQLRVLADLRDQGSILPPPTMAVRKIAVGGGEIAVVEVQPSLTPPVRYKGRIYIRVGPRRAIASADEERRLGERRRSLDLPFDSRPVTGAMQADLDIYAFTAQLLPALLPAEVLAENERSEVQRLAALRLTSQDGVPTPAGLLAAGKDQGREAVEQIMPTTTEEERLVLLPSDLTLSPVRGRAQRAMAEVSGWDEAAAFPGDVGVLVGPADCGCRAPRRGGTGGCRAEPGCDQPCRVGRLRSRGCSDGA